MLQMISAAVEVEAALALPSHPAKNAGDCARAPSSVGFESLVAELPAKA
jgi:hypothetical protein